jgi:hypothetical protein
LDFIEDDRWSYLLKKGAGIAPHARLNIGIFQENVFGLGKGATEEGCFSLAARACDNERWEVAGCFHQDRR